MAQIKISNVSRRLVTLNLPHETACSGDGCYCSRRKVGVLDLDPGTGIKRLRALNRRLSGSLTLAAKGCAGDSAVVAASIQLAPDVVAALRAGTVTISAVTGADEAAAPAAEPTPARARRTQPSTSAAAAETAAKE